MPSTLIITNDFPPRIGGIESFGADVCTLLDNDVAVYASGPPGAVRGDQDRPFPVVRDGSLLLPTRRTAARAADLLRYYGATRVVFGAAAPLGLLAPGLRRAGAQRIVGITHGHEVWWATVPGARQALRRIGDGCDHLTAISGYTERRIGPALSPGARSNLVRLAPPIDVERFRPARIVAPHDDHRPRCVAVGRFVAQKGFDTLLRAWALVLRHRGVSGRRPELILVGDGPRRSRLESAVDELGIRDSVIFTGALPRDAVITRLQTAAVFALPVRTQLAGLNPEGLGLAAIEAAACGLPVIIGASGGTPETVQEGSSGYLLDPDDHQAWAERIAELLGDRERAAAMGRCGRAYVRERFGFAAAGATLRHALQL